MTSIPRIPPAIARKLGYYVYLYVDPADNTVLYVGKGKGARALAHLDSKGKRDLTRAIARLRRSGREPRIEILAHGLPSEQTAYRVEAAAIDLVGIDKLANAVRGWRGVKYGRMPLEDLIAHYDPRRVEIVEPAILIRINRLYHYGMTDAELYEATRTAWKVGADREKVRYAFAIFEGVVREVYRITGWLEAGSTFNPRFGGKRYRRPGRWEFVGTLAVDAVRAKYLNRYVGHKFRKGNQNPIAYVNVKE